MADIKIGIIGGSGLYDLPDVKVIDNISIATPFGQPSDQYTIVDINGIRAVFLPRHGRGHRLLPGEIPAKANIYGFKTLGVDKIIAISAVGSLQEKIAPEDFVLPDQVIDRTKHRDASFFGNGIAGHISFADPFCTGLIDIIYDTIQKQNRVKLHKGGTYICMEGPAFSSKAESNLYRSWQASVIGMTALPEAKLAREAEMCYALIAMSTDYDCWKEDTEAVSVDMLIKHMQQNTANIKTLLPSIIKNIAAYQKCAHHEAARYAVITDKNKIPEQVKNKLARLYEKYF
ncbi:MAG TPA: S-methyl-5'-thioadenosine phosphorylase [Spirochaetota bacterium]|nr:S-methyl-5'-thioadenosine phosphorylase [Spirochaetota bacterium]